MTGDETLSNSQIYDLKADKLNEILMLLSASGFS
jgi:hypothetical protein